MKGFAGSIGSLTCKNEQVPPKHAFITPSHGEHNVPRSETQYHSNKPLVRSVRFASTPAEPR